MNNDLISREALKKALHNFFDGKIIDEPAYILRDVFCYIDNAPTVEPTFGLFKDMLCSECEKRPKGEWRCICDTRYWQFTYEHYECTKCHYKGECKFKYCPSCGAEMQEGDKK